MPEVALKARLASVVQSLASGRSTRPYGEQCTLEVERWALVGRLVARHPFATPDYLARSEQWRRAVAHLRDPVPCPALLDWLLLQVEVAANLEKGVRDMRPRKDGPCHRLTLAYADQRRRKAEVVLAWAEAAVATGADSMRGPSRVFADRRGDCDRRSGSGAPGGPSGLAGRTGGRGEA